jgi:hypothetical protein
VTSLDNAVSVTSNYIDECNIKACLMPFTKYVARSWQILPPSYDRVRLEALFHLPCIIAFALLVSMALSPSEQSLVGFFPFSTPYSPPPTA